jgi:hypothetical protein
MRWPVTVAVEGTTDIAVLKRLLDEAGFNTGPEYVKNGKGALDQSIAGYNNAARFSCWLILRDLDEDASCAPQLHQRLLPVPAAHMRLHIPVRAVEAWLLADRESIGEFLSVAQSRISRDPEALPDPKRALIDVARRSRRRSIREAFVPPPGSTAKVGPGYVASIIEFTVGPWRPYVAAQNSASLARLRDFLRGASERQLGTCGSQSTGGVEL